MNGVGDADQARDLYSPEEQHPPQRNEEAMDTSADFENKDHDDRLRSPSQPLVTVASSGFEIQHVTTAGSYTPVEMADDGATITEVITA